VHPVAKSTTKTPKLDTELTVSAFPKAVQVKMRQQWKEVTGLSATTIDPNLRALFDDAMADPEAVAEGTEWYDTANSLAGDLQDSFGATPEASAGVIAALSPGGLWSSNVTQATGMFQFMSDHPEVTDAHDLAVLAVQEGHWSVAYGMDNYEKAAKIALGGDPNEILSGAKVRSFYNNVSFPNDNTGDVTIDSHMLNAAYGGDREGASALLVDVGKPPGAASDWKAVKPRGADYKPVKNGVSSLVGSPSDGGRAVGVLPMVADSIRQIAAEHGMLPQDVQAILWVHWRKQHPPSEKSMASREAQAATDRRYGRP